jgi:hypothetical protein
MKKGKGIPLALPTRLLFPIARKPRMAPRGRAGPYMRNYSSEIASEGHTAAQEPQSWHFSGSIQRAPSFSEIASAGHSLSQEPQFTHASLIL